MKSIAFSFLIVVGLVTWTIADDEIKCTREGLICLDCSTIAYCNKTGDFKFEVTNTEKCVVNFVCDEWNLRCVRNGICRYTPFSCPTHDDKLVPDPYSCTGYYSCAEAFPYQCGDGLVFKNGSCYDYAGEERCNDYPVLCEKDGQTVEIEGYKYVCKEETIDGKHLIHPVLQL